ncbi:phosphatase domain-containing protein [Altericroceibacterium indicum]|uniref:phosphatase domain-containing protein n=1 Tax=Altericroceibacterium indicum TaxID=374177 RepID=UPI001FE903D4|nr:phosphatase domain-containing protein [Altericroceibacterium indicum]
MQAIRTMLAQFASREVPGVHVSLEVSGHDGTTECYNALSDGEGYVHFDIDLTPHRPLPKTPMWEVVALRWMDRGEQHCVEANILAPGTETRLAVISDIDDTVIETGVTGGFRSIMRNWQRVVATLPEERIATPGVDAFYGALGGGRLLPASSNQSTGRQIPATHRPFFYVSSSPWNLFSYLVAFMNQKNLPLGPLLLRDWGFKRETLTASSHRQHKVSSIAAILSLYPDMRFVLIGDDTQGDLPAYADTVKHFPGRIAAIFIRTASNELLSPQETSAQMMIETANVPLWFGQNYEVGKQFLSALGFTPGGETEQIVKTVEKVDVLAASA